jgi:hypothetical protein
MYYANTIITSSPNWTLYSSSKLFNNITFSNGHFYGITLSGNINYVDKYNDTTTLINLIGNLSSTFVQVSFDGYNINTSSTPKTCPFNTFINSNDTCCLNNSVYDSSLNICKNCPIGTSLDGNVCKYDPVIPVLYQPTYIQKSISQPVNNICPSGYTLNNNVCVGNCPSNYNEYNNLCFKPCDTGYSFSNSFCSLPCPVETTYDNFMFCSYNSNKTIDYKLVDPLQKS